VAPIFRGLPQTAAAVFQQLDGNHAAVTHGPVGQSFHAASLVKLPIAIEVVGGFYSGRYLRATKYTIMREDSVGGTGKLQDEVGQTVTYGDLVRDMIYYSDNVAANVLMTKVASISGINATMMGLGLQSTSIKRKLMDLEMYNRNIDNETSAADMAKLLTLLYQHQAFRSYANLTYQQQAAASNEVLTLLEYRGDRNPWNLQPQMVAGNVQRIGGILPADKLHPNGA